MSYHRRKSDMIFFFFLSQTKLLTESRARVLVLRSEIFNHQGRLDYLEDEELTKLEIKLISVGRVVVATTEKNLQGPVRAKEALVTALSYAKGIIGQIREVRTMWIPVPSAWAALKWLKIHCTGQICG